MTWLLQFDGVNDYVTAPAPSQTPSGFVLKARVKLLSMPADNSRVCIAVGGTGEQIGFGFAANGTFRFQAKNTGVNSTKTWQFDTWYELEVSQVGGTGWRDILCKIDGVTELTILKPSPNLTTGGYFFGRDPGTTSYREILLDYVSYEELSTGVDNAYYDPSASGGTGQILPETINNQDGTLVNFPTDNSQWISTGGGGSITADVNLSISKPVFSVQASKSEPSFNASLSFEVGKPVFSVQAGNTIPGSGATVSLNIASPVFSVQATKEDPPPAPTETASINFEVSKPVFSVQASNLGVGNSANVNLSIPKPQFSVQASRTIPDTIADADITINGPIFTIYAGTDSDSFHYADGAITYISAESKTVSLPSQSRVVTIKSIK